MYELEVEWQTATDGFPAGVAFKEWLANQVLALRAAAQQPVAVDVANVTPCKHTFDGLYCIHCGDALF